MKALFNFLNKYFVVKSQNSGHCVPPVSRQYLMPLIVCPKKANFPNVTFKSSRLALFVPYKPRSDFSVKRKVWRNAFIGAHRLKLKCV